MQNEDITTGALPLIDLTPVKLITPAVPALLRSAVTKKSIKVEFAECHVVEEHGVEGETAFDLSFTVMVTEDGVEEAERRQITKRVIVSNETLAEEARLGSEGMLKILESSKRTASESRRMRELAGIPHKDNFV